MSILPGSNQTAVAQRIIGVRSSIPDDRGESRLGRVSRLARQSESDAFVVPYTRDATSSMVSSGRAIVNSDRGAAWRSRLSRRAQATPSPVALGPAPEPKPGGRGQVANPSHAGGVCRSYQARGSRSLDQVMRKPRDLGCRKPNHFRLANDISFCRTPGCWNARDARSVPIAFVPRPGGRTSVHPARARAIEPAWTACEAGLRWKRATAKKHTISTLKTMLGPAWRLMALVRQKSSGAKHKVVIVWIGEIPLQLESFRPDRR